MIKVELPDFDKMIDQIGKISELSLKEAELQLKIKIKESEITLAVSTVPEGKKAPSQTFIDSTYKITGINNELIPLREELIQISNQLDFAKRNYEMLKLLTEIWRTQSANERGSFGQ
jgi:ferredoxin-fold anticodon binding domain-containing protein